MPIVHLSPNGTIPPVQHRVVGAASLEAALADASDASYVIGTVEYGQTSFTVDAVPGGTTGRLASIGMTVRAWGEFPDGMWPQAIIGQGDEYMGMGSFRYLDLLWSSSGAFIDNVIPAHEGANPTLNTLGTSYLLLGLADPFAGDSWRVRVAKAALDLYYLPAVSVTAVSAPAGVISTTQRPTITCALALTVESWQLPGGGAAPFLCGGDVEFQVFRAADAPGAAPPAGVTPLWSGTTRFSETTAGARTPSASTVCGTALQDGSYVVFARASRDLMAGAGLYWSAWYKSAAWTQATPVPGAPALSVLANDPAQRVGITVNQVATAGFDAASATIEVQRLAGAVWRAVRGVDGSAVATGAPVLVGYDYEAARGVANTYRARTTMKAGADGTLRSSPWTQAACAGPAVVGSNLKLLADPASNWIDAPVAAKPSEESQGVRSVLTPLDRPYPVVVSGVVGGMKGSLGVTAKGAAAIAKLEALHDYAGLVLFEDAFGGARYVALTGISWDLAGLTGAPRRPAGLTYAEVGYDLPETSA